MKEKSILVLAILPALLFSRTVVLADMSFQGLGDLSGGSYYSQALGVSGDGSVVVGVSDSASGDEAFRWTSGGGMVGLGQLPGDWNGSEAWGVSGDGSVVVGYSRLVASAGEAFRWTSGGGMVGLGHLSPEHASRNGSHAYGVSGDGSVVVGVSGDEAFRWTSGGGMVGLGDGVFSYAFGVSGDGSVVVGYSDSASGGGAFRWTSGGGMVGLGYGLALGVSGDGSVVVGESGDEAFRWTSGGGMVGLGHFPGDWNGSGAYGVSGDGSVVVGGEYAIPPVAGDLRTEAFIWDETNGVRNLMDVLVVDYGLDLTGWTLNSATGISANGLTIVGYGTNPAGNGEAWIATVPTPSAVILATLGLSMAGWKLRRRGMP